MTKPVVHMIGQGHIDPVWLWPWTEGRAETMATSKSAVDRLNEYPDFQFSRGESQIYQWIQEEDPALFAQIQEFIRQGRWHVVNGIVIQPDMNLPHGESLSGRCCWARRICKNTWAWNRASPIAWTASATPARCPRSSANAGWTITSLCAPARTKRNCPRKPSGGRRWTAAACSPSASPARMPAGRRCTSRRSRRRCPPSRSRLSTRCASSASATTAAAPPRCRSRISSP